MRRGMLTAALLLALATAPARADMADDCTQVENLDLRIGGCTAVIRSGRWNGASPAWAFTNRAIAHRGLGETIPAMSDVEQVLTLGPAHHKTLNVRGLLKAQRGDTWGAERDWEASFRLGGPDFVRAHQDWLRSFGYYRGAIDGVYGPGTRDALIRCAANPAC